MHHDQLRRLVARAVAAGAVSISRTAWEWNVAGRCQSPVTRELFARKDRKGKDLWNHWSSGKDEPLRLILHVRCRACLDCARLRRRQWVGRITTEAAKSTRTWVGTLTLSPEEHVRAEYPRRRRLSRGGTDFDRLAPAERYREVCAEVGEMLTRYLKRVRKESKAPLRYVAVFEAHKTGLPHLHMAVHEYTAVPVRKRTLDGQWSHGFAHWRLLAPEDRRRAAVYVAKYITKEGARIRASLLYGKLENTLGKGSGGGVGAPIRVRNTTPRLPLRIGDIVRDVTETADW